ncbi:FMRFamide receptor [Caerostris extrusa]|uniref:FMRFamide receptor n=1 Tax=Caerostris extrusa TaxID=172846 RepID=A0AAV4QQC9_CAEEX|nr:FMRFamide receptor [Caerostris extrusa]
MNSSLWIPKTRLLQDILNITEPLPFDPFPEVTTFEFITEGALISTIGLLGVIANFVSLIILSRPQMRSSVNLGLIAQTGSVWTTVAVTVERYIAVCHPLKAKSLCTYRRARSFNLFITLMAIFFNIPRFWEVEHSEYFAPDMNRTVYKVVASQLRVNKLYYEVYHIWLYLLVMYFIPFLVLMIFNILIWKTVRRANKERQTLSRKQQEEFSLAMMLLCVVVVFLICNILALVINIIEYFDIFLLPLVRVSNLLVTVNSSVNFVIYCIFGRKFKRTFLVLFCKYPIQRASINDSFQLIQFDGPDTIQDHQIVYWIVESFHNRKWTLPHIVTFRRLLFRFVNISVFMNYIDV